MKRTQKTGRNSAPRSSRQGSKRVVEAKRKSPVLYPIVGVGASAGGLDAFKTFFDAMPPNARMAFVLIQHLDPTHQSLTAELLSRHTQMKVVQARNGMVVEPDHVFVIPPNKYLSIRGGRLRLSPPAAERVARMPIDFFLRSLAVDQHERAVGIVLSGTGADGALGIKEIKAAGGLSVVQDPTTAQYDGMPRSAIASQSVDHIVAIKDMPALLIAYAQHWYTRGPVENRPLEDRFPSDLASVIGLLRARKRFDFSHYKKGTLGRRMQRRMGLKHVDRLSDYLQFLRHDPSEVDDLYSDLLISVSSFFRDPAVWRALEKSVLPRLVQSKDAGAPIRVWVPGCATGEEAYSITILLIEQLTAAHKPCDLQVFASDVDAQALEMARAGIYPESIAADVSPERLRRFFVRADTTYRVNKELREALIFANQNVITDPPFSKLDLISCRNLLIYLEPEVQKRVISLFNFALLERGILVLGSAENIGQADDLFKPITTKQRIYRRVGAARNDKLYVPIEPDFERLAPAIQARRIPSGSDRMALSIRDLLLERYAPATVVINRRYEIAYFSGNTNKYLQQPSGLPTPNLMAQAREGLQTKLRGAVHRAMREERQVVVNGVRVRHNGKSLPTRITVEPLKAAKETEGLLLISFEEQSEPATPNVVESTPTPGDEWLVRQLDHELKSTREDLQSTIEELETSNEELKASNEEAMSVNEELQSTNEELETSKEEMQSLNEELSTVNAQLQNKVGELERAYNDLDNLLNSTDIAAIFLDRQFRIRRFTPAATKLFRLIRGDLSRPLSDIDQKFADPELLADAEAVLDKLVPRRREVKAERDRSYMRQILPYRTQDNHIEGVVITFSDVASEVLQSARAFAENIVKLAGEGIITINDQGTVLSFNDAALQIFGYGVGEIVGKNVSMLIPPPHQQAHDGYLRLYRKTGKAHIIGIRREVIGRRKGGQEFAMELTVSEYQEEGAPRFIGIVRDVSVGNEAEAQLRQREAELVHVQRLNSVGEFAAGLAHELAQPLSAIANDLDACSRSVRHHKMDPKALSEILQRASSEAVLAGQIVHRLRQLVRKREPDLRRVDLRPLVDGAVDVVRRELERRGVELDLREAKAPLIVNVDEIQVQQVLLNLIRNSLEAMQDSPVRKLEIEVAEDHGAAMLAVRDSGHGFSPEAFKNLFQPFFSTKPEGLGMGLSISRSIIDSCSGRLVIERRDDGCDGAHVRIFLPLSSRQARAKKGSSKREG